MLYISFNHHLSVHTHHALLFADILQFDLSVVQLLGERRLDVLSLEPPRFALLKLIKDMNVQQNKQKVTVEIVL